MTGTGREADCQVLANLLLPVIAIPTNRPSIRHQAPDRAFSDQPAKWNAIVAEILRIHATGRLILVGTRNVAASETLAQHLTQRGLNFRLLNAARHSEEA